MEKGTTIEQEEGRGLAGFQGSSGADVLFSPGHIGALQLKNRLVMPPMVRNYADGQGRVTPRYTAHIERIARGGVGTMILEASFINQEGKGFVNELGVHDDFIIPGLRELVEVAHRHGAVIGPQLYHAGRQTSSAVTRMQPVAPSPIADPLVQELPRAMTVQDIHQVTDDFASAAWRAKQAGCDFAEIHGAHGYLITQFLSPFSNRREDEYGGSFENRIRFLLEVIAAVRQRVGPGFPLILRLSGDEFVPGGLTIEDSVEIAKRAQAAAIDAIDVSAGNYASYTTGLMIQPMAVPDGVLIPLARAIKHAVDIPVITVGKIRYPDMAADAIRNGDADFVAMGRGLLADPDWPNKVQTGRSSEVDHCIACNQGCISRLFAQQDVWCTVNPECGREAAFSRPVDGRKKVLIAGGGPAGMEAAKVAAERGHHVVLFEESDHLGGQLIAAASTPYRQGWDELRKYLVEEMKRLKVDVRLDASLDRERVMEEHPDTVIVATGSYQVRPEISIESSAHAVTARDLLEGRATARGRTLVAGGGCAGAQTAELLAKNGFPVTLVEQFAEIAVDAPLDDRALLLGRLHELGVNVVTNTKILNVDATGVNVQGSQGVRHLLADTVFFCLGAHPNDKLVGALFGVANVKVVGDAVRARRVTDAMEEGALAALEL